MLPYLYQQLQCNLGHLCYIMYSLLGYAFWNIISILVIDTIQVATIQSTPKFDTFMHPSYNVSQLILSKITFSKTQSNNQKKVKPKFSSSAVETVVIQVKCVRKRYIYDVFLKKNPELIEI